MFNPQRSTKQINLQNDTDKRIRSFHEYELRNKAKLDKKLKYLNVSLLGLSGRSHPAISGLFTASDVKKSRSHLKMLVGDYYTYQVKSEQSGGPPHCPYCYSISKSDEYIPSESICHILALCDGYKTQRLRIIEKMSVIFQDSVNNVNIMQYRQDPELLTQFILDPSSLNLPVRVNTNDPVLPSLFQSSRDLCFTINQERMKILKI